MKNSKFKPIGVFLMYAMPIALLVIHIQFLVKSYIPETGYLIFSLNSESGKSLLQIFHKYLFPTHLGVLLLVIGLTGYFLILLKIERRRTLLLASKLVEMVEKRNV